ncbi:MAG: hypothetical protein AAFO87_06210 [Cyanobacteria bacterium J06607_6]
MQNSLTKLESGVFLDGNLDEDIAWISIQLTLEIVAATGLRPVRAENTGAVSPAAIQEVWMNHELTGHRGASATDRDLALPPSSPLKTAVS